jgi:folylpolyglutamate synthase/dihydropteroate synthase
VILDVAHNPAALQVLVEHLRTRSWNHPPVVVFGCMADKDAQTMVRILAATGWPLWLVRMSDEGAGDPADWQAPGQPPVFEGVDHPRFASACAEQLEGGGTVVVCGSHRLVGAVRAYLADPERPSLGEPSEGR